MNLVYSFQQFYLEVGNQTILPFFVSSFFENSPKMEDKINGHNSELKLEFFFAHDNNLNELRSRNFWNPHNTYYMEIPPASLNEIEGNYFVRVIFNSKQLQFLISFAWANISFHQSKTS